MRRIWGRGGVFFLFSISLVARYQYRDRRDQWVGDRETIVVRFNDEVFSSQSGKGNEELVLDQTDLSPTLCTWLCRINFPSNERVIPEI